jgi:hypothetical protein
MAHNGHRPNLRDLAPEVAFYPFRSEFEYEDFTAITDKLAPSEKSHTLAVARTCLRWCIKPPRRYIARSPLEGFLIVPGKALKRILKTG